MILLKKKIENKLYLNKYDLNKLHQVFMKYILTIFAIQSVLFCNSYIILTEDGISKEFDIFKSISLQVWEDQTQVNVSLKNDKKYNCVNIKNKQTRCYIGDWMYHRKKGDNQIILSQISDTNNVEYDYEYGNKHISIPLEQQKKEIWQKTNQ